MMSIVCRHHTMKRKATIRIDLASAVPAYRQIANALRALLVAGPSPSGNRSLRCVNSRSIWESITIRSPKRTVCCQQKDGWRLRRRHGAIVLDRSRPTPPRQARTSLVSDFAS